MSDVVSLLLASFVALFYSKVSKASVADKVDDTVLKRELIKQELVLTPKFSIYDELRYFKREDFGVWADFVSIDLLYKLDKFRTYLGVPVIISPANGSIGRRLGDTDTSQHNVDMWEEVMAVDVMFSNVSMDKAYEAARKAGFHGIGLYPDWEPKKGAHLDVRTSKTADNPAVWSGVKVGGVQQYFSIDRVLS